jgi:hypothetical protein
LSVHQDVGQDNTAYILSLLFFSQGSIIEASSKLPLAPINSHFSSKIFATISTSISQNIFFQFSSFFEAGIVTHFVVLNITQLDARSLVSGLNVWLIGSSFISKALPLEREVVV